MRQITDKQEIKEILSKYEWEMFNRANKFEGEITTLNERDIDDIAGDMRLGSLSPTLKEENNIFILEYPNNVCRLESRKELLHNK
jgi:hypothetical protein